VTGVSDRNRPRQLYRFELEPEVRDWLDSLSDSGFKRVDEVAGMLAEECPGLGGKTRQHDQRQIDRAVRAQQVCERDHRGPVAQTYERQV
jgi:hypothetical protein